MKSTWDFRRHVDRFGNIQVRVEVGGGPGASPETHLTGASARPVTVARTLRELADSIEAAGQRSPTMSSVVREFIENHRSEINDGVRAALKQLDGSLASDVSLLTGFDADKLAELGGSGDLD